MKFKKIPIVSAPAALLPAAASAANGTSNISTLFETILETMQSVSVVLATIAFVYAGYKMIFRGVQLTDLAGPIIGGVIIGAAGWIAGLLLS